MIREVELLAYLPPFMQKYQEPAAALEAVDPEFAIAWDAAHRILYNHFISTADEYGIRRFEKLLDIRPTEEDTLESRRSRVQSKWFSKLPYTLRILVQKLTVLCGGTDFTLTDNFGEGYTLTLGTALELYGQVEELADMLDHLLPCNITTSVSNTLPGQTAGKICVYGGIAIAQDMIISSQ